VAKERKTESTKAKLINERESGKRLKRKNCTKSNSSGEPKRARQKSQSV